MKANFLLPLLVIVPVFAAPAHAEESRWALLVGIDDYIDPGISRLTGSVNDVTAIRETLVTNARFPSGQVFLLTSDDPANAPTHGNVLARLDYLAQRADTDDLVYLHFSLHAVTDAKTGETFLLTHRTDPDDLARTALPFSELRDKIETFACPKKIVVLDGCRNDPNKARGDQPNALDERFSRGLTIKPRPTAEKVAFTQELFACDVGQRAYEWPGKDRGLFSVAVEEALKGVGAPGAGTVTLAGLAAYMKRRVPDLIALTLKGKTQTPIVPEPPAAAREYVVSWAGANAVPLTAASLPALPANVAPASPPAELEAVFARQADKEPSIRITAAPQVPLDRGQARRITIRFEADVDRAVKMYRWRLDDRPVQETPRAYADLTGVDTGAHTFQVQVQDFWGNWSQPAKVEFTVLPNRRPEVAFVSPGERGEVTGKAIAVRLSGTDADGRVVRYRLALDDPDDFKESADGVFTLPDDGQPQGPAPTGITDGLHTLFVQAIDDEGAASLWQSRTFTFRYVDPAQANEPRGGRESKVELGNIGNFVPVYNVSTAAPWRARDRHTSAVHNNKLWVLGGYDGAYYNDVWSSP